MRLRGASCVWRPKGDPRPELQQIVVNAHFASLGHVTPMLNGALMDTSISLLFFSCCVLSFLNAALLPLPPSKTSGI